VKNEADSVAFDCFQRLESKYGSQLKNPFVSMVMNPVSMLSLD